MKYAILIGIVLMIPLVSAIDFEPYPEITIIYNEITDQTNVNNIYDDNIFDVYCDQPGKICNIYEYTILSD